MQCPRCKRELISGHQEKFETLNDHVTDPNAYDYPLRPTFVCPMKCLNGFYDENGDYYGKGNGLVDKKYYYALGSWSREFAISSTVRYPSVGHRTKFFTYLKDVYELHSWASEDIPENVYKLMWYFLRAKYRFYKTQLTLVIPLELGLKSYAYEKGSRISTIKQRIKIWKARRRK